MRLDEVRALVTGAAQGIGRCCALKLAEGGAQVVAGDVQGDGLRTLAAQAQGLPGRIIALPLDVTQEASVRAFVSKGAEAIGIANVLLNNAGILRDGLLVERDAEGFVRKLPTAQWRAVLDTNLTGPYLMAREFAAAMLEGGASPGLIVNISSLTAAGNPGQSNYAAAKAGLDADTRTWALELARYGIRVAGIAPGLIDTPMLAALNAEHRAQLEAQVPVGHVGRPEDIWEGVRFAIACDFFTGRVLAIDGGATVA